MTDTISCYPCGMTFEVKEPIFSQRAERFRCPDCKRPFWSVGPRSSENNKIARVGIDPERAGEWRNA